ncbi:4-hydroxythreonine-4-phosphate dehydrogenase PdxA [Arthrobacter mobilis]|uniref:4-hydroxythreonine-4-phosphate dehydrogenase PdxA n=1 Tax=Arthrobacter mobilis TaxID=2724944 RepID=A0A7X6K5V6_9MICC|nr:4-hydroxythreonine-4-phosphate dehydrogenase PdxA [Arthrobacter mobilis]NKX54774.1 4-hydroxythreonine-4-phosphate dehydrogenase PdxA [Arthrobacter mobilis]
MNRISVLADDFSGAAEVAEQFRRHGLATAILTGEDGQFAGGSVEVIVRDTHSRNLPAERAKAAVARAISRNADAKTMLFKKIDSLWRGNIGPELLALREAGWRPVIAGALPPLRRTVSGGAPYVDGVPLGQSGTWALEPAGAPQSISDLLPGLSTAVLPLQKVRQEGLAPALREALETAEAVIVDGETEQDLAAVAAAVRQLGFRAGGDRLVLVGTGALAGALAAQLAPAACRPEAAPQIPARGVQGTGPRPVLVVVGSASGAAVEQVGQLRGASVAVFDVQTAETGPETVQEIQHTLRGGSTAALTVQPGVQADPALVVARLADTAAAVLSGVPSTDLVLTGGETAREVLDRLGLTFLRPLGQVQHGAVVSLASDGRLIASKPGSFGTPAVLLELTTMLRRMRSMESATQETGASMNNPSDTRPYIAVTMGDGAGVGPEVTVGALLDSAAYRAGRPVVIGDVHRLQLAAAVLGVTARIVEIGDVSEAVFEPGRINVIDPKLLPEDLPWGQESAAAGNAAYHYIRIACELGMAGKVQGICTAPLNKAALHKAGHIYPGHTELLAHFMGVEEVSMMLSTPKVKVIHVTTHIGLIDAIAKINPGLVERTVRRGYEALQRAGVPDPKIGVCAINPHAGENGLFGHGEEEEKIIPALEKLRADGINAVGPLPADTAFFLAGRGDYDLIVAMYHDQGHGPVKVLGIEAGVNITVGLPVIRTSVDHGTAFDIAGKGTVEIGSMIEALRQAVEMSPSPAA